MSPAKKRTQTQAMQIRFTDKQHEHLTKRAEAEEMSIAEYIRTLVRRDMQGQPAAPTVTPTPPPTDDDDRVEFD